MYWGLKNFIKKIRRQGGKEPFDTIQYWKERSEAYGDRAVYNLGHTEKEMDEVTSFQKGLYIPIIKKYLDGNEKQVLDFGCGPGRFTPDLARLINGKAVGLDVAPVLIHSAKLKDSANEYFVMHGNEILAEDGLFDMVWICLVLGGIPDDQLETVKKEILRVSKRDALLFLIENTTTKKNNVHWYYRSPSFYQNLFIEFSLAIETRYDDLNEEITILAGRKK